jgi:glutamate-1-semialdehyde 2,1-aminomutase
MSTIQNALDDARARYGAANPLSMAAHETAKRHLPGGNTRSVLHYEPFPLTMVAGEGAEVVDLDGHRYLDFVGEYSAGLFGHSDEVIKSAIQQALENGIGLGAPTHLERELASLLCDRFPSVEQIRFCNSGTEANLMAMTTARVVTGREKMLVCNGAYHGGVMKFPTGHSAFNIPFEFVYADYNNVAQTAEAIQQAGEQLAAVVVEPILGAGGNIPGTYDFLNMLRQTTADVGALLIFDEVKTARIGPAGIQGLLDIRPDLTTLGKIIGGGLPTGAFGGSAKFMSCYDPTRQDSLKHAGTFNNNVCSMAAGCAAMGKVYSPDRATQFLDASESTRTELNRMFAASDVPMYCNGLGSMFAIHFTRLPITRMRAVSDKCQALHQLLHLELLLDGLLIIGRGDVFLSLPMTDDHLAKLRSGLERFIERFGELVSRVVDA